MEFYKQVFGEPGNSNVGGDRDRKEDRRGQDKYVKMESDSDNNRKEDDKIQNPEKGKANYKKGESIEMDTKQIKNSHINEARSHEKTEKRSEKHEASSLKTKKQENKYSRYDRDRKGEQMRPSQIERMQSKVDKLSKRKKKLIKKLDERTSKGQPVMKNYIKYALTKI